MASSSLGRTPSTNFTASSKRELETLYDSCWGCQGVRIKICDHAHVVSQSDEFDFLDQMDILDFDVSNALENGTMLCPTCYRSFDNHLNPGWVFYPRDLDFFINFELRDRNTRISHPRPRRVPNAAAYLRSQKDKPVVSENAQMGLYVRRILSPDYEDISRMPVESGWQGHPIAAIRNAWRALGAVRGDRVPSEDRARLAYLLELYRTPLERDVPPPRDLPPRPPLPSDNDSGDDADGGKGKGKEAESKGKKRALPKGKDEPNKRRSARFQQSTSTKVMHWLSEVEDRTPPNTPPAKERV